ncbi:penicillin-binding protein 1C [Desulfococcaceae bacterium HSG9]|nr:penicillin-binding protein 1C [Desulfococcaceae bacterium HSG9]
MKNTRKHHLFVIFGISAIALAWIIFGQQLPDPLFKAPFSTVLSDRNGELLGAAIAKDEQWRFPPPDNPDRNGLAPKFVKALLCFEDRRFYSHVGIDPWAVMRAFWLNMRERRIVSGASTLTMQVIRLARKGKPRTISEKMIEMVWALRLEVTQTKDQILMLYAAHAPFGGNVVGVWAASWRYFGRRPQQLSWAEAAMLAVLPNNPALVHPGRNRAHLKRKRDRLLARMRQLGLIDALSCRLAQAEPLPSKPHPLPRAAPHLLARLQAAGHKRSTSRFQTTLDKTIQQSADAIIRRHSARLATNGIHNAAALILNVKTGAVSAYIGNVAKLNPARHANYVDIITAPRSTGSILKPFLYAGMLHSGELLPRQLVPDIPTRIGGFAPENYERDYLGATPAYNALARSLNIPAVRLLADYGVDRFYALLVRMGMTTLRYPAKHYGLSLILGGAEGSLWDITAMYAGLARGASQSVRPHLKRPQFFSPHYLTPVKNLPEVDISDQRYDATPLGTAACWLTLEALLEVVRPGADSAWRDFASQRKIAWKTGTSYGMRDGWAVGVTPNYAAGVWVGNADGEGRPDLTGIATAAPILFELFGLLDESAWFKRPLYALSQVKICAYSGYRAGPNCAFTQAMLIPHAGLRSAQCPFCRIICCDSQRKWRLHTQCASVAQIEPVKWFVLPPAMEWYYKRRHSGYRTLPPFRNDCLEQSAQDGLPSLSLIYPEKRGRIYIPLELDGRRGRTVFKAAHRNPLTTIFWHLDSEYLGATRDLHQLTLSPSPGVHTLTLVDLNGEQLTRKFTVLNINAF